MQKNSVNKVILVGNLGKDPEIRQVGENNSVANFPIATTESFRDRDGILQERTEWHNIVVWRKLAEIAERFLTKGKQVYIEGKLQTRNYEDKEGNTRYITEVVANELVMLGRKEDGGQSSQQQATANTGNQSSSQSNGGGVNIPPEEDDDLPF